MLIVSVTHCRRLTSQLMAGSLAGTASSGGSVTDTSAPNAAVDTLSCQMGASSPAAAAEVHASGGGGAVAVTCQRWEAGSMQRVSWRWLL